ncbi:N-acetyltransferase family protein [Natronorubrum sp. FCH18a]|uniref:GNAT family N-acetyltransferase n=1 Tax=Natronorubrum sp. FCH18a TaxID=3447018 RepID=UPI003F50F46E
MGSTLIRDADSDDIAGILRVTERSWNSAYSEILSTETIDQTISELHEGDATLQLIEREDVASFVAERGEDIVGYLSGGPSTDETVARLGALYVDPDVWNDGIGTELLQTFEEHCRQQGVELIQFSVLDENEIGLSFYRKHGYTETEERTTDRFGEPITERVFRGEVE